MMKQESITKFGKGGRQKAASHQGTQLFLLDSDQEESNSTNSSSTFQNSPFTSYTSAP